MPAVPRRCAGLRKFVPQPDRYTERYGRFALTARDLAILDLNLGDEDGLEVLPLYDEPFVLVTPADHRLAKGGAVRTADLAGETLLLLEDGHCLRDQALEVCSRVPLHEKQDFRATSLETLRQMVASGAGVTLLPELATRGAYGAARGVCVRAFARPQPVRHIGAVWRKTSARREAIEAVAGVIASNARG